MGKKGDKKMDSLTKRQDRASRLTMEYYFKDPNWFDNIDFFEDRRLKNYDISLKGKKTGIQPMRCIKCKKPFQKLPVHRGHRTHTYLSASLFDGVLMEKGVCHECK
jgi:hypothetical protein|tara:strand:+ start:1495 stop:1812 length:318 start_codon:yes stop_codon:yes gene_type:complete